ncbi:MAG: hypothetical protein AB7T10_06070 [bacterium]
MKKRILFLITILFLSAESGDLFTFQSKILPSAIQAENRFAAYLGADFLSYNALFMIIKTDSQKTLGAGIEYRNYGGIITASFVDSSDNPLFMDPGLLYDTLSAQKASIFAVYRTELNKYAVSSVINCSYLDLVGNHVIESSIDAGVGYIGFFEYTLDLMDILPVVYYSNDVVFSYRPYAVIAAEKRLFDSSGIKIIFGFNLYAYYNSYSDQQFLHGKYAFSRSLGIDAEIKRISLYGEFFSEKILLSAKYQLNNRMDAHFSYSGNSLISSIKFGFSYLY